MRQSQGAGVVSGIRRVEYTGAVPSDPYQRREGSEVGSEDMDRYVEGNRLLWNEMTPIHARSDFYDLDAFKAGESSLKDTELEEVGEVDGKSLLHLQCHFGMDTLSWARLGARATGIDISDDAITLARNLSEELGIPARFIRSGVYDLPEVLDEKFDVVFTSYGVLPWLPDLSRWAEVVAGLLTPGGAFHLVEFHPLISIFHDAIDKPVLVPGRSYFHEDQPIRWEPEGTYADRSASVTNPSYEWAHGLADIVHSLIQAGLQIRSLKEYPYSSHPIVPSMEQDADGHWRLTGPHRDKLPLMFSLAATRV